MPEIDLKPPAVEISRLQSATDGAPRREAHGRPGGHDARRGRPPLVLPPPHLPGPRPLARGAHDGRQPARPEDSEAPVRGGGPPRGAPAPTRRRPAAGARGAVAGAASSLRPRGAATPEPTPL